MKFTGQYGMYRIVSKYSRKEKGAICKSVPAPAKASKSSPLESLLTIMFELEVGENRPARLLGKKFSCTSGWDPLACAEKLSARPGLFPTKVSPIPTTSSPNSSPFWPVIGLAVWTTNAYSAGMICNARILQKQTSTQFNFETWCTTFNTPRLYTPRCSVKRYCISSSQVTN